MPRYMIDVKEFDKVFDTLSVRNAEKMYRVIDDNLEEGIQAMAEGSYDMAPVDTTALRGSILASVTKLSRHHYMYGSTMPYAQRQEYEHEGNKTDPTPKKFFFRRSVLKEAPEIQADIRSTVRRYLNG
jgi:hypothetical protein